MSMVLSCWQLPRMGCAPHQAIAKRYWQLPDVRLTAHGLTLRRTTADVGRVALHIPLK